MRHTVACVSIFLPHGIGPSLPRPPAEKEFWTSAVNFPLLCEVTSAPCSEFHHGSWIVQEGTLHVKQKFMKISGAISSFFFFPSVEQPCAYFTPIYK